MKSISISIVLYRPDKNIFIDVLNSLVLAVDKLSQKQNDRVLLVVLDNSAEKRDESFEKVTRDIWSRPLEFIQSVENLGFAKGHNQAIELSQCDFHLILNPDVILDTDALVYAWNFLQSHSQTVLVSPCAFSEDNARQYLCKSYPTLLDLFLRGFTPLWCQQKFSYRLAKYELKGQTEDLELVSVPIVSGCFMFLRRKSFVKVGGFSEDFFLYFEDFDLSIKLRQLGDLSYVPDVKIIHFGGQAAKKGVWHIVLFVRSMCSFFNKHGWRWY